MIHRASGRKSYTNNSMELAVGAQGWQVPDPTLLITSPALEAAAPLISCIFSLWKESKIDQRCHFLFGRSCFIHVSVYL